MKYLRFSVLTTREFSDVVSAALIDYGSEGTVESQPGDLERAAAGTAGGVVVSGFYDENFAAEELKDELARLKLSGGERAGAMKISSAIVASEDWENVWKQFYRPMEIGRVAVVPRWMDYDTSLAKVFIDPGRAFGRGSHDTTAMCLKLLSERELTDKDVIDLGCGSGILGIAAVKLGARRCVCLDIDPLAEEAARSNASFNGVSGRVEVSRGDLSDVKYDADILVANITADVLIALLPKIIGRVKKGGVVIVGGLINARAPQVLDEFSRSMRPVRLIKEGEWQGAAFSK